ncbi:LysR substrate-binding domain-containing protein [Nocardia speluncae]|uniref:LysR substrate-binding domain-containing protein n=1 Tax=Nocardia speluncae TaxID=419477 RepID=UPI00247FEEAD|nr:LysR substrate-binding domain-containing protein [Nocardia speluncae]
MLRYFLAVAEELHFGRAATRLYIAQPSLSQQIRKLEQTLGTSLFVRSNRRVQLTAAGRTLVREAPIALAALERAVELTRLAGSGITTTIRLGYTPVTSFDTLMTLLDALHDDHPGLTVDAREIFSAEIPERLCAGDLDIGLALSPQPIHGVGAEILREEPVSALLSTRHRLAAVSPIPVAALRDETLLLFPRRLAPVYYDGIVAACREAGFAPDICAFEEPPVNAMLARLAGGREVSLAPASFAEHAANARAGILHRDVVHPPILAALSVLWPANDPSPAVAGVLATARRCAELNGWLHSAIT